MICLSLSHETISGLLELVEKFGPQADILEIRLDYLMDQSDLDFLAFSSLDPPPLIFTNRMITEGGNFRGDETLRIRLLEQAVEAGADFIDVEYATRKDLRTDIMTKARNMGTKVIVSFHDFEKTPDESFLSNLFTAMAETGADVIKIVTMARDELDFFNLKPVFQESRRTARPVIAFCMGEHGTFSRVYSLVLGGFLTFASPDSKSQTAPGQLPLGRMKQLLSLLR